MEAGGRTVSVSSLIKKGSKFLSLKKETSTIAIKIA